jgi:hypothetical protein
MKRTKIPANLQHQDPAWRFAQEVEVVLDDELGQVYDVLGKPFPPNLPRTWTDPADKSTKPVRWVSNFELRTKDGKPVGKLDGQKYYTIELDQDQGKLAYFDGTQVVPLETRAVINNRVQADLNQGDPPTGWY